MHVIIGRLHKGAARKFSCSESTRWACVKSDGAINQNTCGGRDSPQCSVGLCSAAAPSLEAYVNIYLILTLTLKQTLSLTMASISILTERFKAFHNMYRLDDREQSFVDWPFREGCSCTPEKVSYAACTSKEATAGGGGSLVSGPLVKACNCLRH